MFTDIVHPDGYDGLGTREQLHHQGWRLRPYQILRGTGEGAQRQHLSAGHHYPKARHREDSPEGPYKDRA